MEHTNCRTDYNALSYGRINDTIWRTFSESNEQQEKKEIEFNIFVNRKNNIST